MAETTNGNGTGAATLEVRGLHATVESKQILNGIDLVCAKARRTR